MNMNELRGVGTALITPINSKGQVNCRAMEYLIEKQIKGGVKFLLPVGTTGGASMLDFDEHSAVMKLCIDVASRRVPVVPGVGSNSTRESIHLAEEAKKHGADGLLVVSPYYIKPERDGMIDYYRSIAEVGLPVCLYDIEGRTARAVPTDVIIQLAREGAIHSVKWASGDRDQLMDLVQNTNIPIFSGNDNMTLDAMALGAHGVISVLSNNAPGLMSEFVRLCLIGDFVRAREAHYKLLPLMRAMFIETNPQPVQTAFHLLHPEFGEEHFRSPLHGMRPENLLGLKKVIDSYERIF